MSTETQPEKKSYNPEELDEFRQILKDKLAVARAEYRQMTDSLRSSAEHSADAGNLTEYGADIQDKEQTEMLISRTSKFVDSLERALIRIENGTYGRCKVSGKLIPKERLRIVPHTETSVEAKNNRK